MNFDDIIEMLMQKKAEAKAEYEARVAKIDELLSLAGYVEPVAVEENVGVEIVEPAEIVEEHVAENVEAQAETVSAPAFFKTSF